jgi:hypothetical protein
MIKEGVRCLLEKSREHAEVILSGDLIIDRGHALNVGRLVRALGSGIARYVRRARYPKIERGLGTWARRRKRVLERCLKYQCKHCLLQATAVSMESEMTKTKLSYGE